MADEQVTSGAQQKAIDDLAFALAKFMKARDNAAGAALATAAQQADNGALLVAVGIACAELHRRLNALEAKQRATVPAADVTRTIRTAVGRIRS